MKSHILILVSTILLTGACSTTQTVERYRPLSMSDGLSCEFSQKLLIHPGPELSGTFTTEGHLWCRDPLGQSDEIELESIGIEDGRVTFRTKQFGTVFRVSEAGLYKSYQMTGSQIERIKRFVRTGQSDLPSDQRGWFLAAVGAIVIPGLAFLIFLRRTQNSSSMSLSINDESGHLP